MTYVLLVILGSFALTALIISANVFMKQRYLLKRNEELERSRTNYESIIDQANDAMFVIDIANGQVYQCNPSAAEMLGYTKEDLEKKTLFQIQPPEYLDKSSRVIADVWENKGLIFKDIPFVTATGELLPVECSARVAPFAGRPAIVIYARDIRERIRLENEIRDKSLIIEEKNKDITASIEYSKRLQRSVFLDKDKLKQYAPESFIFFKPRDIVSGDFYWFAEVNTTLPGKPESKFLVVAAVDCTGHGVPGAFMSIIGNTLLNQTINNPDVNTPGDALNFVNRELKTMLSQKENEAPIRDGMDMSLCAIDWQNMKLSFAGANNGIYIVREKAIVELKPDKQPITASSEVTSIPFSTQTFDLKKGDCIYLFTDGYADQFGGPGKAGGKKFMYKRFREALASMYDNSMDEQKGILYYTFENWRSDHAQVDDVLVIGIRI